MDNAQDVIAKLQQLVLEGDHQEAEYFLMRFTRHELESLLDEVDDALTTSTHTHDEVIALFETRRLLKRFK